MADLIGNESADYAALEATDRFLDQRDGVNTATVVKRGRLNSITMSKEVKLFLTVSVSLLGLSFLIFVIAFIILPIIFMCSVEFQRFAMFPAIRDTQNEYTNAKAYGLKGVRNLYVTVDKENNIVLGVWHLLPDSLANSLADNDDVDYDAALMNKNSDILLYFHGNSGNRISPLPMYLVLRQFFHIVAFDYRGYGDSSTAVISEENVVKDSVELYKWLMKRTLGRIFVWGHSLGAALACNTLERLQLEDITPFGLILEAPFNNMAEEIKYHPMGRIFSWLPWFKDTVINPLIKNGFKFETDRTVLGINCPILILNAEDDDTVPSFLVNKLVEEAQYNRNTTFQGPIIYHKFSKERGYGHHEIYKAPDLPHYIRTFIIECERLFVKNEVKA